MYGGPDRFRIGALKFRSVDRRAKVATVQWKSSSLSLSLACPGTKSPSLGSPQYGCDRGVRVKERERDSRSLRDWELLDALRIRILGLGNCARIKSKGYRGLLFHCALRSVPQSYAVCRSVIGDVSATGKTSRKYSRVPEREIDNIFQTRPTVSISLIPVSEIAELFTEFA